MLQERLLTSEHCHNHQHSHYQHGSYPKCKLLTNSYLRTGSQFKKSLPSFLKQKLNIYEKQLFSSTKNGKHLVLGAEPGFNAVLAQSNDYLSLSKHPSLIKAQVASLQDQGQDLVMSAVFLHDDCPKQRFEANMASYTGYEDALLCQSGWAANIGLMQVIADANTHVYIDFFAHMSLWEGIKSAGAKAVPFRHNNINSLETLIKKHGRGIIVVDSVYSTIGDLCPLIEVAELATRYGCVLVVDESHSLGTHGPKGAGLVAELGIGDQVQFITASLAKAFAARAGIILCANQVARCFPYIARSAIFSSTLLPYEIVGLEATLSLIKNSDTRRKTLHNKAAYFRQGLKAQGYKLASNSQIVSIEGGREEKTEQLRDALEARDVFGSVFCSPATPKNRSLLRFSVNSNLSYKQLDDMLSACDDIRDTVAGISGLEVP